MRVRRFNKEFPNGKLFTDPEELDKAIKEHDWWDAKWKVGKEPSLKDKHIANSVPKEEPKPAFKEVAEKKKSRGNPNWRQRAQSKK